MSSYFLYLHIYTHFSVCTAVFAEWLISFPFYHMKAKCKTLPAACFPELKCCRTTSIPASVVASVGVDGFTQANCTPTFNSIISSWDLLLMNSWIYSSATESELGAELAFWPALHSNFVLYLFWISQILFHSWKLRLIVTGV